MMELCKSTSAYLDKNTNALLVRCAGADVEDGDAPDFGDLPFASCLGVVAMPPEDGAEMVVGQVPGLDGVVVGGRSVATADAAAQMKPGETAMLATGKGFLSRIFFKDRLAAIVVGNGTGLSVDVKNKKIQLFGFGLILELNGKEKEIRIDGGGAGVQIGNGVIRCYGDLLFGNGNAPLAVMLGPTTGSPGGAASAPMIPAFGIKPGQ